MSEPRTNQKRTAILYFGATKQDYLSSILRTELSGYNTVGEEIRIVWMGFNEGRVSASQTLLTQQFWGSSKTRRSSKVLHWGDEWD